MSRLIDADLLKKDVVNNIGSASRTVRVLSIIDSQPTVNQWIPVERELPPKDKEVLVTVGAKIYFMAWINEDGKWYSDTRPVHDDVILAWQPIQPYEVKKEGDRESDV